MDYSVEIHGLRLEMDGKVILDGIDLSIAKGEFIAVVGPNGSGKTTLLKCLDGLNDVWQGHILLNCKELHNYSRRGLARIVAYVPQQLGDLPDYSVRDFVALSRYSWDGGNEAVEHAIESVGMSDFADRRLGSLSGGELQKVSIASALAQDTEILLLDEPTAFLDPKYSQQIWQQLGRLKVEGNRTIIAVTHDVNSACAYADRICGLKDGKLFALLPSTEFMDCKVLEGLFDARFEIVNTSEQTSRALALLKFKEVLHG